MTDFAHQMLREIYDQPDAIERTLALYLVESKLNKAVAERLAPWTDAGSEVLIAASGSSRHAGLYAEILLEDLCGLAVDVEYSSEYSFRGTLDSRHPKVIVLSQSGETTDTLAALGVALRQKHRTIAITNVATSTMSARADVAMPLAAGKELAIPATKSFVCQLTVMYALALYQGAQLGLIRGEVLEKRIQELESLSQLLAKHLDGWRAQAERLASHYKSASTFLYLGRGIHYAIAREGALKMKESSYVHAEGYPAGELKHGPNALVTDSVPVVMLATVDWNLEASVVRYHKVIQLLGDLRVQGAKVLAIANAGDAGVASLASDCVFVPAASEYLLPIFEVVPLQLLAYYMALVHGVDVDRPRNLSKAVVEQ